MEFKKGFKIKPDRVDNSGRVYFTDGTDEVNPNQLSCEAYGYKYNKFNGTCSIDSISFNLSKDFDKDRNSLKGINNKIESRVSNVTLNGNNNIAKGQNNSVFVSGNSNTVANGVNNAAILSGTGAVAIRTGEVIVGGSLDDGLPNLTGGTSTFITQTSRFHMTAASLVGGFQSFATLSGVDGVFGFPMQPNSLAVLKCSVIASSEALGEKYMATYTASVTCNASGITELDNFLLDKTIVNNLSIVFNLVDGDTANTLTNGTLYNRNQVYGQCAEQTIGTNNKNIAWSLSIELVEQIHNQNTSILTN